jgi:hypothetical protein
VKNSAADCQSCGEAGASCDNCEDSLLRTFTNPAVHIQSLQKISYIRRYRGAYNDVHATFP